jgi:3-isopropylmalate/(R)-2-methylmalate dehydratase small subunit
MSKITNIQGTGIPLFIDDIDTDRIIPARFLRCVTFDGIGEHAFEDDRQQDPNHPFNKAQFQQGTILVSGRNFGCGSSREHAPQSLMRWGVKVVVAESFAEIFFGNCTALGVPAVTTSRTNLEEICNTIDDKPDTSLELDLLNKKLTVGNKTYAVDMPKSAHDSLTSGRWDFLSQLLENKEAIQKTASSIPYLNGFKN